MGYSLFWLGVAGKPRAQVLRELGLELGAPDDHVSVRTPVVGVTLPSGWFVVVLNRNANVWYTDEALASLSAGCRVMTCEVQETSMSSSAAGFQDGRQAWRMLHDEGQARDHLETEGELPPEFAAVYAAVTQRHHDAEAEAAELGVELDVDHVFDAPADLGQALTGFRHDYTPPPGSEIHALTALAPGLISVVPVVLPPPPGEAGAPPRTEPPAAAGPPPPSSPTSSSPAAPWQDRAFGLLMDGFVVCILFLAAMMGILGLSMLSDAPPPVLEGFLPLLLVAGYLLLRDTGGVSYGKRKAGVRVEVVAGGVVTPGHSIRRNLPLVGAAAAGWVLLPVPGVGPALWSLGRLAQLGLLAYEAYRVATGRPRLGDRLAGTRVAAHPAASPA